MNVAAEALAGLAVLLNFVGYRQPTVNRYRAVSALALMCLGSHFLLIDAMAAGVACWLAALRNLVALRTQHVSVVWGFVALNLGFFAYEWWWLAHGPLIFVAYASALIFTVGSIVLTQADAIRRWFILAEGLGLVYAVAVGSVFGTVFNLSNLASIFIKLYQQRQAHKKGG
ncbi:YgjV family protein [Aestuariibacter halophilus]|uniref:YgjV family protein n=1 Tax=Fluctibacter halophilus TaxID=226011 RepID=A0ABS8G7S7_9ALTE|nr:YgjV family protein [Aestuariibacter halophilus]MCC2616583.1 YgjV family protein [Aestuariibacter halophilus]